MRQRRPARPVRSRGDYSLIQDAVNDAGCTTINVGAGTYNENVTIGRAVILNGAQLNPANGAVLAVSGLLNGLDGLTFDAVSGRLFASSVTGHFIYSLDPNDLTAPPTSLCTPGGGGPLQGPDGIASDGGGSIFIADFFSNRLVQYNQLTGTCAAVGPVFPGIAGLSIP